MDRRKPIIRPRPEHALSRKHIDEDALRVLYRLSRGGFIAHLVGGGVRDLLLGREPKDFDVVTDAQPKEIKKLFRNCFLIGKRFRLAHIRFSGNKVIETSTFRRSPEHEVDPNDPLADLYRTEDNEFGSPEEDAWRRDFTINGLFYDIRDFSVVDHVGGLEDLEKRLVRSIGDADVRFREDPVRMLRAVRFASRLGFHIEENTWRAILNWRGEIWKAAPPRLLEEVYKLFGFSSGEPAFRLLKESGLLAELFPEVASHLEDVPGAEGQLWDRLAALDASDVLEKPSLSLCMAALFMGPILERAKRISEDDEPQAGALAQATEDILRPVAMRFSMPKAVTLRVIQLLIERSRLEKPFRRAQSKARYLLRDFIPELLAFYEVCLASGLGKPEVFENWRGLWEEAMRARRAAQADHVNERADQDELAVEAEALAECEALLKERSGESGHEGEQPRKRRRRGGRRRRPGGRQSGHQGKQSPGAGAPV